MAANSTHYPLNMPAAPSATAGMADIDERAASFSIRRFGLGDWHEVRAMLLAGYCNARPGFWDAGFARLQAVPPLPGDPPLGVLLECERRPVGVAIMLPSRREDGQRSVMHVNASSWAILPAARGRAMWMARRAMADAETVYTALTPIASASAVLQRIGFRPISHQCILGFTPRLLGAGKPGAKVWHGVDALRRLRDDPLAAALDDHLRLGCLVMALDTGHAVVPLVWRSQRRLQVLRTAELLYTPSQALVAEHMATIARHLLGLGYLMTAFEADADLVPDFSCTRLFQRRLARGPYNLRGIDHLYSELVYLHR